ncbi:MAG: 30S ribosomal protein S21 [bacterium]|nr:30S ribosomal protein S21 [bacterium]
MMTNAEVARNDDENNTSVLRRFTKRVQGSGVLNRVRSIRFFERTPSKYKRKAGALKRITRRDAWNELSKLGKVKEGEYKRGKNSKK